MKEVVSRFTSDFQNFASVSRMASVHANVRVDSACKNVRFFGCIQLTNPYSDLHYGSNFYVMAFYRGGGVGAEYAPNDRAR
jgi:hypothetical protein